jgi:hypothetical protein
MPEDSSWLLRSTRSTPLIRIGGDGNPPTTRLRLPLVDRSPAENKPNLFAHFGLDSIGILPRKSPLTPGQVYRRWQALWPAEIPRLTPRSETIPRAVLMVGLFSRLSD